MLWGLFLFLIRYSCVTKVSFDFDDLFNCITAVDPCCSMDDDMSLLLLLLLSRCYCFGIVDKVDYLFIAVLVE